MNRKQPISLIVLLFVLVSIGAGYSQNGAVFNPLQPVTIKNGNGNDTTAIYNAPTISAPGTLLTRRYVGSGKSSGGGTRDNNEFILKQNTAYLLRITEGNVANTNINWELDWYEHTNK